MGIFHSNESSQLAPHILLLLPLSFGRKKGKICQSHLKETLSFEWMGHYNIPYPLKLIFKPEVTPYNGQNFNDFLTSIG